MTDSRKTGRYYTPALLAECIAREALDSWFQSTPHATHNAWPRVLDPSCGNGAFLLAVLKLLAARLPVSVQAEPETRAFQPVVDLRAVTRTCLFGVDIDCGGVGELRRELALRLGLSAPPGWLSSQIVVGDALTGPGFNDGPTSLFAGSADNPRDGFLCGTDVVRDLNWKEQFPEIAREGGFDLIVGNPPYVRERDSKSLFDRLAQSPLGRRWRTARMDLWYYFVHRALDLLKPGGLLAFIVPSYWVSSRSAEPLIRRLQRETILQDLLLLEDRPVFSGVQGRHLVLRLRRQCTGPAADWFAPVPPVRIRTLGADSDLQAAWEGAAEREVPATQFYQPGGLQLRPSVLVDRQDTPILTDFFEVRQGIAENPPRMTPRLALRHGVPFTSDEGVFVLTQAEIDHLKLGDTERRLLRPYFRPAEIELYRLAGEPRAWLLYLTRKTAPELKSLPQLTAHLQRFRRILEARREVGRRRIDWWNLHWPREERLFLVPRLLGIQMGRAPRFAFVERPAFTGFATHVVVPREGTDLGLPVLAACLNSSWGERWFEQTAKRRGVHIEISGGLLRRFPLPPRHVELESRLDFLVRDYALSPTGQSVPPEINAFVEQLYARRNDEYPG